MINKNKAFLFIFTLFSYSLSFGGHHNEPSIGLSGIEDNKTYSSPVQLNFVVKNIKVQKAGINELNSGHHHLLLDVKELPDFKISLPMTKHIIHFGKGQTSTLLELAPGIHTIQLLFADYSHTPHKIPLITEKITFYIK